MPHRQALLSLALALGACRKEDTPTDPTESAAPEGPTLLAGSYTGVVLGKEDDTCGDAFVYEVAPGELSVEPAPGDEGTQVVLSIGQAVLGYSGEDRFSIGYGSGATQRCTVGDDGVTCKRFDTLSIPFTFHSAIEDFVVTSDRSFTQREVVDVNCVGGVCADFGEFPCTMAIPERFEAPLTEAEYCFDGLDNDVDNLWDHLDADCPRFVPEFWSVTGEFGYDAAAGGVVPFELAGATHRPTVTIRIHAAQYWHGVAYPAVDPAQICEITLVTTGSDPVPTTLEEVPGADGGPTAPRHAFRPPPDRVEWTTTCPAQGLFGTETWGPFAEVAALGWGLGVGPPAVVDPRAPDALGAAARFGVADAWVAFGTAEGWAVDAEGRVLDAGGEVAGAADVSAGALQVLPASTVSGSAPLPTGAYVITSEAALRYGG